jgi:HK97 family phage major capsid protein
MELSKAREYREQRMKLVKDAQALPDGTKEERAIITRMLDDAEGLKSRIDLLERAETADAEFRTGSGAPPNDRTNAEGEVDVEAEKRTKARHHKAWSNYMKYGLHERPNLPTPIQGIGAEDRAILMPTAKTVKLEARDMGSGGQGAYPGATTGFFVPVGFMDRIEEALKYFGPMLQGGQGMPEIMDTATGQPLPFPTDNDTAVSGELIGEGQQVTTADVTLGQIILGAYKFSSKLVKVSIELLQDSAFDLEAFLIRKFGVRLGRALNTYFTVGAGTTQPNGIVTASTLGVAAIGSSNNDGTSASTNTIGSDDLTNLEHSVDPLYRPGALYMFHDSTLRSIKTVKDKYGRPLWVPGVAVNAPDTINGYGYRVNNDFSQLQTQSSSPVVVNKTVLFGQISKYVIRRVKEMSVLRLEERYADQGQVAFLAFARYDGNLLDAGTHPVKYLTNSF